MSANPATLTLPPQPQPLGQHRAISRSGWEVPTWKDPRVPFFLLLATYAVLGFTLLGFNRQWWQMALIVGSGCLLEVGFSLAFNGRKTVPLSAAISCTSLAILLNYSHHSWVLFFPVFLTIGSKYLLTFENKHVFNPSMFGIAMSLLLTREWITAAPAYQWAGGSLTLSLFIATAALMLFIFRVGRTWLVVSFLIFYALQTGLRAYIMRHHLPWETLVFGTLEAPPFYLFTFYMLTDPATSPKTPRGQGLLALAVTLVDLVLHLKESVYTFFYAALTIGTARFLFMHGRALWQRRGARVKEILTRRTLTRVGVVGGLGTALMATWVFALAPLDAPKDVPLAFTKIPLEQSGLGSHMGTTLTEVDPRIQHVAKWVLSVGDAVGVGDVDGDGRLDLVLTHPLATADDRVGLFLNRGELHFERVPVPALDAVMHDPASFGLAGGAVLLDDDGDGDLDLLVPVAFGPTRFLRNRLKETGALTFEDVTTQVGLGQHTVSLAATWFDYDNDGRLDLLITNTLTTHLPDYAKPTPLNVFKLPAPEYEGDRRMFRFMHNGWHDADNGGRNQLFHAKGDGTFEPVDMAAMGLPETHWSLAVGTQDFDGDGFTDLYIASDFGPDDVYLNEAGRHFKRLAGPRFGDIGRDTYKGMNVSIADLDNDGHGDVYVSNVHHSLQSEGSLLWMVRPGKNGPTFTDEATQRGALNEHRFGWGAQAGDLDLDGWPDLVQANGMVDDRLDKRELGTRRNDYWYVNQKLMQSGPDIHTYADRWGDIRGRVIYPNEARRVYWNRGGTFVDIAQQVGLADPDNSRGVLLADLDGDGDLDCLVTNQHGPVSLYRNEAREKWHPHYLALELRGPDAIGAKVSVTVDGRTQVQEVGVMGGFSAQASPVLTFGLGQTQAKEASVVVEWHRGGRQQLALGVDQRHTLTK